MQSTRALLVMTACLLVPAFGVRAEPPEGEYSVLVGGPGNLAARMRLLEGTFTPETDCQDRGTFEICETSEVHTDAAGNVTGFQRYTYTGTTEGVVDFVINGTVKAAPGIAKAKLLFAPQGTLDVDGVGPSVASGKGKGFCRDDVTEGDTYSCDSKIKLCFEDPIVSDCDTFFTFFDFKEQQAAWLVTLDLSTAPTGAVTGSGHALLANGVEIDFSVKGKYSSKTDTSNITLKGLGIANKSKILLKRVRSDEGELVSGRLKFKVASQSGAIDITAPAPPP